MANFIRSIDLNHGLVTGIVDEPVDPAADIDATGTPDATTFLRGDGAWAVPGGGSGPVSLFDEFADAGNDGVGVTDLYTYTIPANTLAANGDKLILEYAGVFAGSTTPTRDVTFNFDGSDVDGLQSITITGTTSWGIRIVIIRVSSTDVRYAVYLTCVAASDPAVVGYWVSTGHDFTAGIVAKITGNSTGTGEAADDVVAKMAYGQFVPAA